MKTEATANNWIKMTERRPTKADLPVWGVNKDLAVFLLELEEDDPDWEYLTHWRSAKADIPEPPREETQYDKDRAAFIHWDAGFAYNPAVAWHAAIAYERAEVAKMLPHFHGLNQNSYIESIRARCEGGAK